MLTAMRGVLSTCAALLLQAVLRLGLILTITCALFYFAPGSDSDERQLDTRLDANTIAALKQARSTGSNPLYVALRYVGRLLHGDLGHSETYNRPVSELLAERSEVTLRTLSVGLLCGLLIAFVLASATTILRSSMLECLGRSMATSLLCAPSAILAFGCIVMQAPPAAALACVVSPRVFLNLDALLQSTAAQPHVLAAEAMGMRRLAVFKWHIAAVNVPQMAAVAAASMSTALGALVPIEVISDSAGIGQLAWKATLGRDLSLLAAVTLLMAAVNTSASLASDSLAKLLHERSA